MIDFLDKDNWELLFGGTGLLKKKIVKKRRAKWFCFCGPIPLHINRMLLCKQIVILGSN